MRHRLVTAGLLIIFSALGFGDVMYLHRLRNDSVEFFFTIPEDNDRLFAMALHRDWVKPDKVLYHSFGGKPYIENAADQQRMFVQKISNTVNVTIKHLLGRHTALYRCLFHYNSAKSGDFEDRFSSTQYFLHVEDSVPEECACYSYEPLLYSLSAAAVLLFVCVLILTGAYCKRPSSQPKPLTAPIYEEMNGVRTGNEKARSYNLKEEQPVYTPPRKENPYDPLPGSDPYSI